MTSLTFFLSFLYEILMYPMLPCICSVIDHRRHQNVIGDLFLNRCTTAWKTFVDNICCKQRLGAQGKQTYYAYPASKM